MQVSQPIRCLASLIRQPHPSRASRSVFSHLYLPKAQTRLTSNSSRSRLPIRPPHNIHPLPNRPLHTPNPRLRHQHHTIKDRRSSPERKLQVGKVDCSAKSIPSSCFGSAFSTQATKADTCGFRFLRAIHAVQSWICVVVDWCYHCCDCYSWKAREGLLLPLIVEWVFCCRFRCWCFCFGCLSRRCRKRFFTFPVFLQARRAELSQVSFVPSMCFYFPATYLNSIQSISISNVCARNNVGSIV